MLQLVSLFFLQGRVAREGGVVAVSSRYTHMNSYKRNIFFKFAQKFRCNINFQLESLFYIKDNKYLDL